MSNKADRIQALKLSVDAFWQATNRDSNGVFVKPLTETEIAEIIRVSDQIDV